MSAPNDPYAGMARHYDLHGWDWYAAVNGARLVTLLREQGLARGDRVLDAGCGTGSLALLLADEGFRVTGVDLSASMIARARSKDEARRVPWHVGDITHLELGETFDAIVSVADILNHLPSLDAWEAALRSFHAHVRPGGLVFVDAMTCAGLEQMDVQSVQERGGITVICAIIWDPSARRSTLKVTSFVPDPGGSGLYDRAGETITEWGYPVAEILDRMRRAGFGDVGRVWEIAADPERDDRVTLVARR